MLEHVLRACAVAAVIVSLAPLAFGQASPLVGTWESGAPNPGLVMVLEADGTGKLSGENVRWAIKADKLEIVVGDVTNLYAFSLAGDALTVSGGDLDKPLVFARKGAAPKKGGLGGKLKELEKGEAKTDAKTDSPIGAWRSDDGSTFQVNGDGTALLGGRKVPCEVKGNVLVMTAANGSKVEWPWRLENGALIVTVGANTMKFARLTENAAPPAPPVAGASGPGALVGRWRAGDGSELEFLADGTLIYGDKRLKWTAGESKINLNDGVVVWTYKLSGDKLSVVSEQGEDVLVRVGAAPAPGPAPGAPAPAQPAGAPGAPTNQPPAGVQPAKGGNPVGAWDGPKGTQILRQDGTALIDGEECRWTVEGSILKLIQGEKWVGMPFTVAGDQIVLGTGPFVTLSRAGIAGVWVGEEASLDPGIYLSFTQYVVLYKDGTVGYAKSEGYAQRTQVSSCLERFWSGSQTGPRQDNVGTWRAEGNQVEIRFNWKPAASRAVVNLDKWTLTIEGMGKLPGNEGGALAFKRR